MTNTVRERSEIEQQFTWNTESVFADKATWEAEVEAIGKDLLGGEGWDRRRLEE